MLKRAWYALGGVLRWLMVLGVYALPWLYSPHGNQAGASSPEPFLLFGMLIAGQVVAVVVHELGHLVAALAVRSKVRAFRLGRDDSLIQFHLGGVHVVLGWPRHGRVEYVGVPSVWKRTVITLAGPLAVLVLAAVVLAVPLPVPRPVADVLGLVAAVDGLANLMPFKTRGGRLSDGASLLEVAGKVRTQRSAMDVQALKHGGESLDKQAERISQIVAAQQKEDRVATENIGTIASKLRQEGRYAELLELHAGLKMPSPPIPVTQASAIASAEFSVSMMPNLPSDAAELAERRVQVLLRYHDLGPAEPVANAALAFLLLRLGRFAEVERPCRQALAIKDLPEASRRPLMAAMIIARQELRQPYDDLLAKASEHQVDVAKAVSGLRQTFNPGYYKQFLADIKEFAANPKAPPQPGRADRLLAAYRAGDPVATEMAGYIGAMLQAEGRTAEMLKLHAELPLPAGPRVAIQSRALNDLEWSVVSVPGMPAGVLELAATRLQRILDNCPFDGDRGALFRAAVRHTLAMARLRQGLFDEVEPLCAEGLASTAMTVAGRAAFLATVAMARRALGQPYEELLAQAQALDPTSDLVKEAASPEPSSASTAD